ncbi:MAG TPA: hypothetical protein VIJ66_03250 [Solirubrobacteraceae bacterium]
MPVLLIAMFLSVKVSGPVAGAIIALAGVLAGLWVSGDRTERQRRRDLHARSLAAILAYAEMPFMIRRRRHEPEQASAERVRLSSHFSTVKAELTTCQVLLAADGDQGLAAAYDTLVDVARRTAGQEAHDAWEAPQIATDAEMNMGRLFDRMHDLRSQLDVFREDLAKATLPRRTRLRHRLNRDQASTK